ncbi:translation initiation factor 2 [hydrocarbon metagenome]|uniref:Translation initiation factor 2 n=1 Tax=hydrocarbon metagenome TaxID=938273 RepID=A0A0W8FVX6_9ZZZZ
MAEKTKKLRIYKFASEYNLATDTIVDFLRQKGYDVKSHMSLLTDEMIGDINDKFRKDIETAEKHYRKISEFQKKRGERVEEKQTPTEEPSVQEKAEDLEAEPVKKKTKKEESKVEEIAGEVSAEEVKEVEELSTTEEVKETPLEPFQTDSEKELTKKKKGLTVVGKIELEDKRKKKKADKKGKVEEVKPESKEETKEEKKPEKPKTPEELQAEEKQAGKRKKKKLKAKKREAEEDPDVLKKNKRKKKAKKFDVDVEEVEAAIKRTLLSMDETVSASRASFKKKKRKEREEEEVKRLELQEIEKSILHVTEFISVSELANLMKVPVSDVIQKCIEMGIMVSINQRLDGETITLVADEFDYDVKFEDEYKAEKIEDEDDPQDSLIHRPPVVTIMGHVDHGKTSLLDHIRKANVVAGESGGITQHIGAYRVQLDDGRYISFLDTPGHEAFTAMRARGAKVTDIVVLIVAADDAVMPQTVEAINHAQAAGVPIVIAINKIDKPGANPDKIKQQLADRNILVEDWGGKYQCVQISAKTGLNIDELLEKILLEAEVLELKANPDRKAHGTVIESQLDKGRGVTATVLIQKGTMKVGDPFVAGNTYGRVRAMFDERNNKINEASPSTPALVLGFDSAPQAGDTFIVVNSEREAREIGIKRQQLKREQSHRQIKHLTLDEIANQISQGGFKELPIVVKGDVDGSVEALADSLMKLSNNEVAVSVIHKGVGAISEGDVLLAAASNAIIVGFHVRPHIAARKLAEQEKVDIRLYNVIYDAINEVKSALEGMLSPVISEENVATIEVREIFKVPKVGTIAGCYVQDGKITRNNKIRLFRDGVVIYTGELASLKRFKDDVKEVDAGYECGLNIANFNDIKVGDIIEGYKFIETKKKLV